MTKLVIVAISASESICTAVGALQIGGSREGRLRGATDVGVGPGCSDGVTAPARRRAAAWIAKSARLRCSLQMNRGSLACATIRSQRASAEARRPENRLSRRFFLEGARPVLHKVVR